jgi:hypothetical protein
VVLSRSETVIPFDAETYLRLLGERLLLDQNQQHGHHRSPLDLPAAALVAAGAIDRGHALRVIDDHTTALGLRVGERGFPHFGPPAGRRRRERLTPGQTVLLDQEIAVEDGLLWLRDLAIMPAGGGTIRFRWRSNAVRSATGRSRSGGGGGFPWGSTPLIITDDEGNRPAVSSGSGSGSGSQWDGELRLDRFSPSTTWLEIDGTQIALDRRVAPSETWIEPIEDLDPVERFLRRRLEVPEMPFHEPVELTPAMDALRAAGALAGREQLTDELEAISAQLPGRQGRHRQTNNAPAVAGGRLPEPWWSLLARVGRNDGRSWTRVLSALTPKFDEMQVAFRSVTSDSAGFEAEFQTAPNVLHTHALDELPVAWSARDDRQNHYLGEPNGWSGGNKSASGTMRYWPALDPRAKRLELVISAQKQRAIVVIPLDDGS